MSQEVGKVVWYSHLLKNFPQFVVIHTVKGFGVVNEAKVDVLGVGFLLLEVVFGSTHVFKVDEVHPTHRYFFCHLCIWYYV